MGICIISIARRFFDSNNIIMKLLIFKQEPHEKDITLLLAYGEKGSVVFSYLFYDEWTLQNTG